MSLWELFREELGHIFSDVAILLTIFGGVVLYAFLYPQPYLKENISEIAVSVVDYDNSKLSREIIFMLDATPNIRVVGKESDEQRAMRALFQKEVQGIVVLPHHLQKDMLLGASPVIAIGTDANYFLVLGAVVESSMKAVLTKSTQQKVKNMLSYHISFVEASHSHTPYSVTFSELFNEGSSYLQYVVPAVFVLILQQTMLIGMGILGGSTNEKLRSVKNFYVRRADVLELIFVRMVIFMTIFALHVMFYFGYMYGFYELEFMADIVELSALSLLFLFSVASLGIFLGAVFSSREIATPLVLFSSLPLVFSVGFIWPQEAMPEFVTFIASFSPSTPAILAFLKLNQMGAGLSDISYELFLLTLQGVCYLVLGYYFTKRMKEKKSYGKI